MSSPLENKTTMDKLHLKKKTTTIFICTHSCSKINYDNENIKGKN